MKRVVVTGAAGFIGRHCLAPLRAAGFEVHAVDVKTPVQTIRDVLWHRVDLFDSNAVERLMISVKASHLLHLAWFAVHGEYWTSLENLRWVQASLDLFQAFARAGGNRMLVAGSCAEYDWRYGWCSEETTPLVPATLYGASKQGLQTMADAFAKRADMSAAWGRVFFAYGPHEDSRRLVPAVVCSLLQNKPALCSHGDQIRDFLYVEDVAEAFVSVLGSNVVGPLNIASGQPVFLKDIVHKIGKKLGKESLIRLGVIPAPPDDPPVLLASVKRLTGEVGWKARFTLDRGLDETIEWWRTTLGVEGTS
jgi:nucleoside-diphosphate-sugar epimerase